MGFRKIKLKILISLSLIAFILLIMQSRSTKNEHLIDSIKMMSSNQGDTLVQYLRAHERILPLMKHSPLEKVSLTQVGFGGGYGNKLYSFISSLVIAILTDSKLVVKWPEVEDYVQLPINAFTNENMMVGISKKFIYYISTTQSWQERKNISELMKTTIPINYFRHVLKSGIIYFF